MPPSSIAVARTTRPPWLLVPLVALMTLLSACGGDEAKIDAAGVPELRDGFLDIGSTISYAPIEFIDPKTNRPAGLDVDIANALAGVLGVKARFTDAPFDGLLLELTGRRHEAVMSAVTVNSERKAVVDFVEYFSAGSGIVVPEGNPKQVRGPEDLCGLSVAVQEGTIQVDFIVGSASRPGGLNQRCVAAGKRPVTALRFVTDPQAVQAVLDGIADANIADFPVAAYSAKESGGRLAVVAAQIEPAPYGIAVRKDSPDLQDALTEALSTIQKNGKYDSILKKWGLEAGSLE